MTGDWPARKGESGCPPAVCARWFGFAVTRAVRLRSRLLSLDFPVFVPRISVAFPESSRNKDNLPLPLAVRVMNFCIPNAPTERKLLLHGLAFSIP